MFISSILAFSLLFYSFSIVTSGLEQTNFGTTECVTFEKWYGLVKWFVYADIMLTIVIPFLLIFLTSAVIIMKLMGAQNFFGLFNKKQQQPSLGLRIIFRNMSAFPGNSYTPTSTIESSKSNMESSVVFKNKNSLDFRRSTLVNMNSFANNEERKSVVDNNGKRYKLRFSAISLPIRMRLKQKYTKTTGMLITISITFLLLNFPMAISKLKHLTIDETASVLNSSSVTHSSFNNTTLNVTPEEVDYRSRVSDIILQRLAYYLYYLNFSLNFSLYALSGSNFRSAMIRVFMRFCRRFRNN